jgi:nitroreductase
MEFADVVRKRRMVHVFEQRPVDPELVDRLLDTARRGPSAGFSQGSDFLVLDTPATITRFFDLTEDPRWPNTDDDKAHAPTVIVLALADKARYIDRYSQPDKIEFGLDRAEAWPVKFWETDTAMACMLLLLAAVDAGLGGWLFGIGYGEPAVREVFGIPADRDIVSVVGLGYEGVDESPKGSAFSRRRRPLSEMVHRNTW